MNALIPRSRSDRPTARDMDHIADTACDLFFEYVRIGASGDARQETLDDLWDGVITAMGRLADTVRERKASTNRKEQDRGR